MPEIDPVIMQLRADVAKYRADMEQTARRVEASLDLQERSIIRLDAEMDRGFSSIATSSSRASRAISSSMSLISSALAGVSIAALARGFLSLSDESKKLDATLKLATQGFGSFGQAQEDVRRIADDTRSGLSETASLYANFVRGAKELGGTQAEAARATETFSKTLKISGADANQAASATLQFGQALAAGALRGDELNSILEASPRLARLLAESMGQPIGQIKQLGEEGKLTSDKLLRALTDQKFTAGIDAEFRQLPITFDDAMTSVYNAALTTFSAFDRGGQFSTMLANFFGDGADGFSDLERQAFDAGAEIRASFAGLKDVFDPLVDGAFSAFGKIEGRANYARDSIANILRLIDNVDNTFISVDNFGRRVDNKIKSTINEASRRAGNTGGQFSMTPLVKEADRAGTFLRAFNQSMQQSQGERAEQAFRSMIDGYDVMGNPLPGRTAKASPSSGTASSGSTKRRIGGARASGSTQARKEISFEDQIAAIEDAYTRAQAAADAFIRKVDKGFLSVGFTQDDLSGRGIQDSINEELAARQAAADAEAKRRQDLADELAHRQEQQIYHLANLFEDGFRGGTKAIWGDFKTIGFRILAEMAARFAVIKLGGGSGDASIGGLFSAATQAIFGRASGGYVAPGQAVRVNEASSPGKVEGFRPIGAGHIIPLGRMNAAKPSGTTTIVSAPTFDLSKAVITPQLYVEMQRISDRSAAQYSAAMGKKVLGAVPSRLAQYQSDGI